MAASGFWVHLSSSPLCFFFNDTATTEIYTLSLHYALPIYTCDRTNELADRGVGRRLGVSSPGASSPRPPPKTLSTLASKANASHKRLMASAWEITSTRPK